LTPKLLENLEGEILKAISHRHIVELEDCIVSTLSLSPTPPNPTIWLNLAFHFGLEQKNDHHIYLIMAFCSGGDLSIYIKKRGRLPTLDYPRLLPDGTRDVNVKEFWPHPEEGGLDAAVTRCFLGQLSELIRMCEGESGVVVG
jgi:serine/threonine-protein kinase ULK/ATG1